MEPVRRIRAERKKASVRRWVALWIVALIGVDGCVSLQGRRMPGYAGRLSEPAVAETPSVLVVLTQKAKAEGIELIFQPQTGDANDPLTRALLAALKKSPLMARASTVPERPVSYVLFLDATTERESQTAVIVLALTAGLFPASARRYVAIKALLYEASSGKEVALYEARNSITTVLWLPFLIVSPITIWAGPSERDLYESGFEDVFIQVAYTLKDQVLPPAVDPARLEMEPTSEHQRREIRLK